MKMSFTDKYKQYLDIIEGWLKGILAPESLLGDDFPERDRKSTRLNSSH